MDNGALFLLIFFVIFAVVMIVLTFIVIITYEDPATMSAKIMNEEINRN